MAGQETSPEKKFHYRLTIRGTVQGVGFRPFIYHLANKYGLYGQVQNSGLGVVVEVEGPQPALDGFYREALAQFPALARIQTVDLEVLPMQGYTSFTIVDSQAGSQRAIAVPPDIATCRDCRGEILNPADRHYLYPFTNCTHCGPRFTIIRDIPYDRCRTAMATFPPCQPCSSEYHDPSDRRFHAQPVACPACGPQVELVDSSGKLLAGPESWREQTWDHLARGEIVAIKGLGGFHLACDATNGGAVALLRRRKGRDAKPLAVMARDLATVKRYCCLNAREAELLTSPRSPIVILERRREAFLPEALAPNLSSLGVMLPYTPLHLLLFEGPLDLLVMTSANRSELPLVKDNRQALEELAGLADCFLWHNREIVNRCDDSLATVAGDRVLIYRRSRGFVPQGVTLKLPTSKTVLGVGGEIKNTFCLWKGREAFLSQHIGDLSTLEGETFFREALDRLQKLLGVVPEVVGYDLHPGYNSSRLGRELPALARFPVQHHHAHLAACLAENGCEKPAIGLILDGTGYGPDGALWGFEVLSGSYLDYKRHYHLRYVPLPGGEEAVRKPWRVAVAYLVTCLGQEGEETARRLFGQEQGRELEVVMALCRSGFNSPLSGGCGRLFDAVAALAGVCQVNTYEGQAACELSELMPWQRGEEAGHPYPCLLADGLIDPTPLLQALTQDLKAGVERAVMARRFHDGLAATLAEAAREVAGSTGLDTVALSGGTWQNRYLLMRVAKLLQDLGLKVLQHREVPSNDGGLALGQAVIAARRWEVQCA